MNDHSRSIPTNQGTISVKRCSCGGVHVCLGGVSINLAKETAQFLKEELEKACAVENNFPRFVSVANGDSH